MTVREEVMQRLYDLIVHACDGLDPVPSIGETNESIAEAIDMAVEDPAHVRLVLSDGDGEEPGELFGEPMIYEHTLHPVIEMIAVHPDEAERRPALELAVDAIVAALTADETLGGLVDLVRPLIPDYGTVTDYGAPPGRTVTLLLTVLYTSADPVG